MTPVECPSGFVFEPRKITGRLFAQLASKSELDDLTSIVEKCCVRVIDPGPYALAKDGTINWKRVLSGDVAIAFLRLRAISIPASHDGELFQWQVQCANRECLDENEKRTRFFWRVRLCDLPIIKLTDAARDIVRRGNDSFPGKLMDGRRFTFKLPTDEDAPVIRKLLRESGIALREVQANDINEVLRPYMVAAVVQTIEGVAAQDIHTEVVDLDPWTHADMQRQIGEVDAGIEPFKGKCPACSTEVDLALPYSPRLLLSLSSTELKTTEPPKKESGSSSEGPGASLISASPG